MPNYTEGALHANEVQAPAGRCGMKRKRIDFVPEGHHPAYNNTGQTLSSLVSERYLSLVLKHGAPSNEDSFHNVDGYNAHPPLDRKEQLTATQRALCEICKLPVDSPDSANPDKGRRHEASIAHMDLDSRLGLGISGEGIRAPVKVQMKNDTVGLGIHSKNSSKAQQKNREILDAKKALKREVENSKKREKLQEIFYGSEDVLKYLDGD